MERLLPAILFAAVFVPLINGARIGYDSQQQELFLYREQMKVLHQLLASECPEYVKVKRQDNSQGLIPFQIEVSKKVYNKLLENLVECRNHKFENSKNLMTPSTPPTTTTTPPVPKECLTATNFTDASRLDHNGSDLRPGGPHSDSGYACDFYKGLGWFRFTGAAGNRMLNYCPKLYSCGTLYPYWSDEEVPKVIGVPTTITAYMSYAPNHGCKYDPDSFNRKVEVMRCSLNTDHDLIYKYTPDSISINWSGNGGYYDTCNRAFCGMM